MVWLVFFFAGQGPAKVCPQWTHNCTQVLPPVCFHKLIFLGGIIMATYDVKETQTTTREAAVMWVNVSIGDIRLPYGIPLTMSQIRKDESLTMLYESFPEAGSYTHESLPGLTIVIPGKVRKATEGVAELIKGFVAS